VTAKAAIKGSARRMFLYSYGGIGRQVCALLLIISVSISPLSGANARTTSVLIPLRTSFAPLGSALQLPPESLVSLQASWTVNKRLIFFVRKFAFTHNGDSHPRELFASCPASYSVARAVRFPRSPPA
jgi:hypothetical protein